MPDSDKTGYIHVSALCVGLRVEKVRVYELVMKRWLRERTGLGSNSGEIMFGRRRSIYVYNVLKSRNLSFQ